MNTKRAISLLILAILTVYALEQVAGAAESGNSSSKPPVSEYFLGDVLGFLSEFQSPSIGGFTPRKGIAPNACTSAGALYLSNVYGVGNGIKLSILARFLDGLENDDGGYAMSKAGDPSSLEGTACVLEACAQLVTRLPHPAKIVDFIHSLERGPMYSIEQREERGSIRGTLLALRVLKAIKRLGALKPSRYSEIRAHLKEHLIVSDNMAVFDFPVASGENPTTIRAWAIALADMASFDFNAGEAGSITPSQWIAPFTQSEDGSIGGSVPSTRYALEAISVVARQKVKNAKDDLFKHIKMDKLERYLAISSTDLDVAIDAHSALTALPQSLFETRFKLSLSFDATDGEPVGKQIVVGREIRPTVSVVSVGGASHALMDVSGRIVWGSGRSDSFRMKYDPARRLYVAKSFYLTVDSLGPISVIISASSAVDGLSSSSNLDILHTDDTFRIGFDASVTTTKAAIDGRELKRGEPAVIGTQFVLQLGLKTLKGKEANLKNGSVSVLCELVDSSGVVLSSLPRSPIGSKKDLEFALAFKAPNVPTGSITFRFSVFYGPFKKEGKPHTVSEKTFAFKVPMVAADIDIVGGLNAPNRAFRLGDEMTLSMTPASLPSDKEYHPYPPMIGKAYTYKAYHFVMDVTSRRGSLLHRIAGRGSEAPPSKGSVSRFTFDYRIGAEITNIGETVLMFKYIDSRGKEHSLVPIGRNVLKGAPGVAISTDADLVLGDLVGLPSLPSSSAPVSLDYGAEMTASFTIFDRISRSYVTQIDTLAGRCGVWLALQHSSLSGSGSVHTSSKVCAKAIDSAAISPSIVDSSDPLFDPLDADASEESREEGKKGGVVVMRVAFTVSPNAVRDVDTWLTVAGSDADGTPVPIHFADSSDPSLTPRWKAIVGGDISVVPRTHITTLHSRQEMSYIAQFDLSQGQIPLADANLRCDVALQRKGGVDRSIVKSRLPVADNGNGTYEATFTVPIISDLLGRKQQYVLVVYRDVDLRMASDEMGADGSSYSSSSSPSSSSSATPMFEIILKSPLSDSGFSSLFSLLARYPAQGLMAAVIVVGGAFVLGRMK